MARTACDRIHVRKRGFGNSNSRTVKIFLQSYVQLVQTSQFEIGHGLFLVSSIATGPQVVRSSHLVSCKIEGNWELVGEPADLSARSLGVSLVGASAPEDRIKRSRVRWLRSDGLSSLAEASGSNQSGIRAWDA